MAIFVNRHVPKGAIVHGEQLRPGEIIRASDVYDSTDGKWHKAGSSFGGSKVTEEDSVTWVRLDPPPDCDVCHGPCCGADA